MGNVVFPGTGTELVIDGDGVYEDGTNNPVTISELRVKHTGFNPATNYYGHLVLNGGEVFNGDTGLLDLQGRLDVQANSVLYSDVAENRSFQIDSWLTGSGNIFYHDGNLTNGAADFNVTGTTNTFTASGWWIRAHCWAVVPIHWGRTTLFWGQMVWWRRSKPCITSTIPMPALSSARMARCSCTRTTILPA